MVFNFLDSISYKFAIHLICSFLKLHKFLSTSEILKYILCILKKSDIGMYFSIFHRWLCIARTKYCRDKDLPPFALQVKMTLSCPQSAWPKAVWPWVPHPRHLTNAVKTSCAQTWSLDTPRLPTLNYGLKYLPSSAICGRPDQSCISNCILKHAAISGGSRTSECCTNLTEHHASAQP